MRMSTVGTMLMILMAFVVLPNPKMLKQEIQEAQTQKSLTQRNAVQPGQRFYRVLQR